MLDRLQTVRSFGPQSCYLLIKEVEMGKMTWLGTNRCTFIGTIIEIEQRNLRGAGAWIKSHAEAIFNTTYWSITPEEGLAVRFTQTLDAFYITTLYPPNNTLVLTSPVPYLEGDEVTVVGGNLSGTVVPSELSNGNLTLTISGDVRDADEYAWVFKISYATSNNGTGSGGPGVKQ